jgi:hypothetical protein
MYNQRTINENQFLAAEIYLLSVVSVQVIKIDKVVKRIQIFVADSI